MLASAKALNPRAEVYVTASKVSVDLPDLIAGKRVLCVEDGPTTTLGGMASGAAAVAAAKYGAAEVVDPRPFFVGELKTTHKKYPHIGPVVPAMGYSEQQVGTAIMWCGQLLELVHRGVMVDLVAADMWV